MGSSRSRRPSSGQDLCDTFSLIGEGWSPGRLPPLVRSSKKAEKPMNSMDAVVATSVVVGIDPGLDGGVALMDLGPMGEPAKITVCKIPTKPGAKNGREIDSLTLARLLRDHKKAIKLCAIELVHAMPEQGTVSTFNFGMGFGKLLAVLECLLIPHQRVQPQTWKKAILLGKGPGKEGAIRFCMDRFPEVSLLATEKCKTPHDGIADALCLAEYARCVLTVHQTLIRLPSYGGTS